MGMMVPFIQAAPTDNACCISGFSSLPLIPPPRSIGCAEIFVQAKQAKQAKQASAID
jgi:hypothetical protein